MIVAALKEGSYVWHIGYDLGLLFGKLGVQEDMMDGQPLLLLCKGEAKDILQGLVKDSAV